MSAIVFDLLRKDDIIHGNILIDSKQYCLPILTKDVMDLLTKMTGQQLPGNLIDGSVVIPRSVNDLLQAVKAMVLEVKIRLMAYGNFQGVDGANKAKFEAIWKYYNMREDESVRHKGELEDIEKWLDSELAAA